MFVVTLSAVQASAWSPTLSSLARDIARAVERNQLRQIAIVPLLDLAGKPSVAGAVLANRLILDLVGEDVEVIERSRLDSVLAEIKLGLTGALEAPTVRRLGGFLGVDAIVTGTVLELDDGRVEVQARLIEVRTARVLSAGMARVAKDWSERETLLPAESEPIEAAGTPAVERQAAYLLPGIPRPRRLAQAEPRPDEPPPACDTSDGRLVEARARYWALRLREPGFNLESLRRNPGSEIVDASVRRRFYDHLNRWHAQDRVPPLSRHERVLIAICR